jgi:hypothetical protein
MKYAVNKGSVVMIYILSLMKIAPVIQPLLRGIQTHTERMDFS